MGTSSASNARWASSSACSMKTLSIADPAESTCEAATDDEEGRFEPDCTLASSRRERGGPDATASAASAASRGGACERTNPAAIAAPTREGQGAHRREGS